MLVCKGSDISSCAIVLKKNNLYILPVYVHRLHSVLNSVLAYSLAHSYSYAFLLYTAQVFRRVLGNP